MPVPEQADPAKNMKVTVPVGLALLVTVALSVTEPPTLIVDAESVVVIVGISWTVDHVIENDASPVDGTFENPAQ